MSSYIRFYGLPKNDDPRFWGLATLIILALSILSIFSPVLFERKPTFFLVSDSNAPFALCLSVASFMFFKNLNIGYSKWINNVGATTFGVFLIHTRGNEMRHWLWYDIVDCGGHYNDQFFWIYSILIVVCIFTVCSIIDRLRIIYLEKWTFRLLDPLIDKIAAKYERK